MVASKPKRIDEVSRYYRSAVRIGEVRTWLFVLIAIVSLLLLYIPMFLSPSTGNFLRLLFIKLVVGHFVLSIVTRYHLVPKAERMRRKQMLSNAFGAPLSFDQTSLYYNNSYPPSLDRLGANTMENALFSKEIASKMLVKKRLITGAYVCIWFSLVLFRQTALDTIIWITQLVFSGEIAIEWIKLEMLRFKHEQTFKQLHDHFLYEIGTDSPRSIANVIDAFVEYEATKSSTGVILSERVFKELNPSLTCKWDEIRRDLKMDTPSNALGR